jgi:hypothetical protein
MNLLRRPERVFKYDILSYYAYLPGTFILHDYTLKFIESDPDEYYKYYWPDQLPNGNYLLMTSLGLSIMYAPFFFIAHLLAEPLGYTPNGFSAPYGTALLFGCWVYLLCAFLLLRQILSRYYSDRVIAFTLLIIGLTTNLLWYATAEAAMSHAFSFFLFTLFLYCTLKWYDKQSWSMTMSLGLTLGLISLIRPTNVLVIIVFLLFGIVTWNNIKELLLLFWKNNTKLLLMAFCTFLIWVPQLLYWKSVTGQFLYYSYGSEERFFFDHPHLWQFLFGFRKGWLIYTPSMILAIVGFYFLWKNNRKFFFPLLFFILPTIYILSSWWCWWFGGGFGQRSMIESYAFLSLPLAAFFSWVSQVKLKVKVPVSILIVLICSLSGFNCLKYKRGSIHWDAMTKEAYFHHFFKPKKTDDFYLRLEHPDYKAARRGIDAVESPQNKTE